MRGWIRARREYERGYAESGGRGNEEGARMGARTGGPLTVSWTGKGRNERRPQVRICLFHVPLSGCALFASSSPPPLHTLSLQSYATQTKSSLFGTTLGVGEKGRRIIHTVIRSTMINSLGHHMHHTAFAPRSSLLPPTASRSLQIASQSGRIPQ